MSADRNHGQLIGHTLNRCPPPVPAGTDPAKEFSPQWGDSRPFVEMAFKSLWGHYAPDA